MKYLREIILSVIAACLIAIVGIGIACAVHLKGIDDKVNNRTGTAVHYVIDESNDSYKSSTYDYTVYSRYHIEMDVDWGKDIVTFTEIDVKTWGEDYEGNAPINQMQNGIIGKKYDCLNEEQRITSWHHYSGYLYDSTITFHSDRDFISYEKMSGEEVILDNY